jgi:hypothetical protein
MRPISCRGVAACTTLVHDVRVADLESRAQNWVTPWPNARHLVRTKYWLLELEPEAGLALRLAALTHDAERNFPGSPQQHPDRPAHDRAYREAHQVRSAEVVAAWLEQQGADQGLRHDVRALVRVHEWGGWLEADLLQAADSISFLEVHAEQVARSMREHGHSRQRVAEQFDWMYTRIGIDRAQALGRPIYERALTCLAGLAPPCDQRRELAATSPSHRQILGGHAMKWRAVNGHRFLANYGHQISPLAAVFSPHPRP